MPAFLQGDFRAGRYRAVVEALLDLRKGKGLSSGELASLVGALSFLGRVAEAEEICARLAKKAATGAELTAARFFLGIGWTRQSRYAKARRTFRDNEKTAGRSPLERFYVQQGRVFYFYYTGRFRSALRAAEKARIFALRSGDLFARSLATDALGHCRVLAGEIHAGLQLLADARALAEKLGNRSLAGVVAISCELYESEFFLSGPEGLPRLEARLRNLGTEDHYPYANVGLELARQYTLRGRYRDAADILAAVAPAVYANENRRQEVQLQLRLAELAGRRGDFFQSRHFLWMARRLLHREVDSHFELMLLGIERKLALAEGKTLEAEALLGSWQELSVRFPATRDENLRVRAGFLAPECGNDGDIVHKILSESARASSLVAKLQPLLEVGFLAEAAKVLQLDPGREALAILPGGKGFLVQRPTIGVEWSIEPVTGLQQKLLRLLAQKSFLSKEELVAGAWGYQYDSLRHDAMVYTALSALRRNLGSAGEWLRAEEAGYRFAAAIHFCDLPQPEIVSAAPRLQLPTVPLDQLNHRQIEILEWLRQERFIGVLQCRKRFGTSEVTALRDLDGLRQKCLVIRTGKARATRYALAEPKGDL